MTHENDSSSGARNADDQSKEDLNELRVKVAELVIRDLIQREQWTPWQREDDELLYGGHSSRGLWIYRRPDKSLSGINYDSLEELKRGTVKEYAKRHNFSEDLNACAEFEKWLTEEELDDYLYRLEQGPRPAALATAEQRCRAFVATMEKKQ